MSHSHFTDSVRLNAHVTHLLRKIYHLMTNWSKNGTKYRILNFLNHQNETVSGRAGGLAFNEFAFSLLSYVPCRPFYACPYWRYFWFAALIRAYVKRADKVYIFFLVNSIIAKSIRLLYTLIFYKN